MSGQHSHPSPLRTLWRLLVPLLAVLVLTALVAGALGGAAAWLLRSEAGTAWLIDKLPGLQARGVKGALLSSRFEAEHLEFKVGTTSVVVDGLLADGLSWLWRPDPKAWLALDAKTLTMRRLNLKTGPRGALPATLELVLRLNVDALKIDELNINALPPLRAVQARVALGFETGARHRIDDLAFDWDRVHATASAQLGSVRPFALAFQATLAPIQPTPGSAPGAAAWSADIRGGGNLEKIELQATLRGKALPGKPAPALDLRTALAPYAPWPLERLSARTQALDLSALLSAAPQTQLSGSIEVQSSAIDAPISAEIKLDNALAGRWNEARLPLRHIELALRANAKERERLDITAFDVLLGAAGQDAGRWRGTGQWRGHVLQLDTRLADLRPQHLDTRAAKLTVGGPLALTVRGLPSPDPAAAAPIEALTLEARSTLDGRLDAAPVPVRLQIEGSASAQRIELKQLKASAGAAVAQLHGLAQRGTSNAGTSNIWQVQSEGALIDFDPVPWWPGDEGSAWRQGPHRLSGQWQIDLRLPTQAQAQQPLALLQTMAGTGTLRINDSVLAGVPLQGSFTLGQSPNTPEAPSNLRGELRLATNRLTLEARGNPLGDGQTDRWSAEIQADALGALAPLARLIPALAEWAPREGTVQASLSGEGRWPKMRSSGQASLSSLRLGELAVARGQASWRVDTATDQPLSAQLNVAGVRLGRQALELLRADLQGTLREHVLQVDAALTATPPALAEPLLGVNAKAGTRAKLRAEGAWLAEPGNNAGGTWRGRIAQLQLATWDGKPVTGDPVNPWLDARDLKADLRFDARGDLMQMQAEPGSLRLADGVLLRWDEVRYDLRGTTPDFRLRAELEPFAAAPVLARLQPNMGWSGDLRLAASIDIKAAERFDADIVFERRSGDLQVTDISTRQALGLTELRLAMTAHDGQWRLSQAVAGSAVGVINGSLNLSTSAQQRWPNAQTPITGNIEARVANLGAWGAWVPPGWRLSGSAVTSAAVSGQLGAPAYTGRIEGKGIGLRNLLQGVDVNGGEVAIALKGATAQIETFTLRGGDGQLTASGNAEFGATPSAQLKLKAERFRVLGRVDRQLTVSGSAELALKADQVKLDGDLRVDEGRFDVSRNDAPSLDDDVSVRQAGTEPAPDTAQAAARPRRDIQVNLRVDLGDQLKVRGRGLDTELEGQLRISTPGGRLSVQGRVSTDGGTYAAYGQKLDIERGILSFTGPPENPSLDILALRPNIDNRVGVAISGSLVTPRVRLFSEPDMNETDKLSWLVLGRAPDGLGRADTTLLQRAAVALLAGEGEAPTDALMRNIGLTELSLRQSDGEVRETVITLGKQLSRRWYVGYERGINSTTGTWQLIYRIAQRFTLRAQSGHENSLDAIWVWRLGEPAPMPVRKSVAASPAASSP